MNRRTRFGAAAATAALALLAPAWASAHAPDPTLGGALWGQNQQVSFFWRAGAMPPAAIRDAIRAGADDSNDTRSSRAATFVPGGSGSPIGYGPGATCGVNGIACFDRSDAPRSFAMWFREHGRRFDWGVLRWCQLDNTSGCYDAENVALDEFGHVQILAHHDNLGDGSDYLDAVVQALSRTKPRAGWNAHAYGVCDVATLQMRYDVPNWAAKYSTCLSLVTATAFAASDTSVPSGGAVTFTATVKVGTDSDYLKLSGNPLSSRTVALQRRPVGGGTWSTVTTMAQAAGSGTYQRTLTVTASYQWRASFAKPPGEGLRASNSAPITVTVRSCSPAPCPHSAGDTSVIGGPAS